MNILIVNGRVVDPASNLDRQADIAIAGGVVQAIGDVSPEFRPERTLDAQGCLVVPGLVDLAARLREPGYEHEGMLESEMGAAVAGGVTSLVCPPDTDPVLDEPGLVEMLKFRARNLNQSHLYPLGALTRGLGGEILTEMAELTEAGCVGFSQAEVPLANTQVMLRAMQYAATHGYAVWLRPQELYLGKGEKAAKDIAAVTEQLRQLDHETRQQFPLSEAEAATLAGKLKDRILALHAAETAAARRLRQAAG